MDVESADYCIVVVLGLVNADSLVEIESEDESLDILNWQLIIANDLESYIHVADTYPTSSDEIIYCSAVQMDEDIISIVVDEDGSQLVQFRLRVSQ